MWDRAKKKELGYKHPKSRVWTDADGKVIREVLHEQDWKRRVEELEVRCGGRCEWRELVGGKPIGRRCTSFADDPHHIIKRWPRRDDRLSNLQALCRFHHNALDPRKVRSGKVAA